MKKHRNLKGIGLVILFLAMLLTALFFTEVNAITQNKDSTETDQLFLVSSVTFTQHEYSLDEFKFDLPKICSFNEKILVLLSPIDGIPIHYELYENLEPLNETDAYGNILKGQQGLAKCINDNQDYYIQIWSDTKHENLFNISATNKNKYFTLMFKVQGKLWNSKIN